MPSLIGGFFRRGHSIADTITKFTHSTINVEKKVLVYLELLYYIL